MPERWQRELTKLEALEAREAVVRERIERGPTTKGPPGPRERLIAGVVAATVFLAAGAFAWRALTPSDVDGGVAAGSWPVATVSFTTSPTGERVATLRSEGVQQTGFIGASTSSEEPYPYAWVNPTLPTLAQPLPIPMGSELKLEGEVMIKELLYGDAEQLDAGAGPDSGPIWADQPDFSEPYFLPWDEDPERTYLKFFGTWSDGSVLDLYFEVVFVAPDVDLSDTRADIVVTPEPMGAVFLYGGQRSPMGIEGGTYGNMSITSELTGFDERAIVAKVPAGTPLEIGGEHLVDASVRAGNLPFGEGAHPLDGAVPASPGRYVLTMDVTWDGGSATFLHQIEVVPAQAEEQEPSPSAAGSVVVDIRRSGGETAGFPTAIAAFAEQEVVLCASGWSLVGPDGTREGGLADCARNDEFMAPAGTPIVVTGDHASLVLTAHGLEDRTEYGTDEVPALEPGSVVSYRFDVGWPDGSTASYGLFVTISEPLVSTSPDPEEATEDAAPALRVRCGEEGAQVLTPVVTTQSDGLHVEPVDAPPGTVIGLLSSSSSLGINWWSGREGVDDDFVRQVPAGEASVVCVTEGTYSGQTTEMLEAASRPFLLIDAEGFFTPYDPECESVEEIEASAAPGVDPADASDRIRSSLRGIQATDVVETAGYEADWGHRRWWRVVREGVVVAGLIVGEQGRGVIHGWACRSSGIEGDPPT